MVGLECESDGGYRVQTTVQTTDSRQTGVGSGGLMQIEHHPAVQTAWLKACPQGSSAELTGSPRAALP